METVRKKTVRKGHKPSRWVRFLRVLRNPRFLFLNKKKKSTLRKSIITAYDLLFAEGLEKSLAYLSQNNLYHSPRTPELFKAIVAPSDALWVENMNRWLKQHSRSRIVLKPGNETRFLRIRFEGLPPVSGEQPKISVIMAAHNAEATIEQAIRSILQQTWENLELIVVNDKSTDGTPDILEDLARLDQRLVVFHNSANVGPYVSKNLALTKASGDFVTGHDADDLALPERLEKQVQFLLDDPALVGTYGHMVRLDEAGRLNHPSRMLNHSFDGILRRAMISLMLRREVFEQVGFWDSVRFGADSEFLARVEHSFPDLILEDRGCTMLCLNKKGSLTNNPATGIALRTGLSPIRTEYRDSWRKWHQEHENRVLYRPFCNDTREFGAPERMIVSQDDIDSVQM